MESVDKILTTKVRFFLYLLSALGSILGTWLLAAEHISAVDGSFITALSAFIGGLAALKTFPWASGANSGQEEAAVVETRDPAGVPVETVDSDEGVMVDSDHV